MPSAVKVISSLILGICNSFYVFNLSTLLALLILSDIWASRRNSRSRMFVISFLSANWVINFILVLGGLDQWLDKNIIITIINAGNIFVSCIFFGLGILNLREWATQRNKRDNVHFKVWPLLSKETVVVKAPYINLLGGLLFGFLFALLGSLWPQDYYLFVLNHTLLAGFNINMVLAVFLAYGLGLLIPVAICYVGWKSVLKVRDLKGIFLVKIISSAILLSVSLGLIYMVFKI